MKKFSIKLDNREFHSDDDGMLDLNDIWRGCELATNKRPSQWRSKEKEVLVRNANMHSVNGDAGRTVADERATIAYAMWVSVDFYLIVVDAFVALRNGEVEKATVLASATMSKEDAHYLARQSRIKGMTWDEAAAWAGINKPRICRKMFEHVKSFKYLDSDGSVTQDGEDSGFFYNRGNKFNSNAQLRVTPEGREILRKHRGWINNETEKFHENIKARKVLTKLKQQTKIYLS